AQLRHPLVDPAAVRLDLRLAGPAQTHTAIAASASTRLPGQGLTPAAQSREHVLHLRQRDLRLALAARGARREDVEDAPGPVEHLDVDRLLECDQLPRRQFAVADHRVRVGRREYVAQFLDLAGPDVGRGVRLVAPLDQRLPDLRTGGL